MDKRQQQYPWRRRTLWRRLDAWLHFIERLLFTILLFIGAIIVFIGFALCWLMQIV